MLYILRKGGIPRKVLIAHWQNSDVSSQVIVVSTFNSIYIFSMVVQYYMSLYGVTCSAEYGRIVIIADNDQQTMSSNELENKKIASYLKPLLLVFAIEDLVWFRALPSTECARFYTEHCLV